MKKQSFKSAKNLERENKEWDQYLKDISPAKPTSIAVKVHESRVAYYSGDMDTKQ